MIYVDSSALFKFVSEESESAALESFLTGVEVMSSEFVVTELRRAALQRAHRDGESDPAELIDRANQVCTLVNLVSLDFELLLAAGTMDPATLRSLDAIHLASALFSEADEFVTYDRRQAAAARSAGLTVSAPG